MGQYILQQHCAGTVSYTHLIDVLSEGICMNPFAAMTDKAGKKEPYAHLVNANVQALSCAKNMGNRQIGVLREAIEEVLAKQADHSEDDAMDALREGKFYETILHAMDACTLRANELGK